MPRKGIGKLVNPSPGNMKLFHLRLLLLNRRGITSFKHLRRVNEGEQSADIFEEACRRLGQTQGRITREEQRDNCPSQKSTKRLNVGNTHYGTP